MGNNQTAAALSAIATSVNWERSGLDLQAIVEAGNQGKLGKPLTDWLVDQSWKVETVKTVKSIRTINIDLTKGFKNLIDACGNAWVNEDVNEKLFQITAKDGGEWEYDLWDSQGAVSFSDAVKRMKGDDKDNPWTPARLGHLLVFGDQNQNAQRKHPILALGQTAEVVGGDIVTALCVDERGRVLYTFFKDAGWGSGYRFLRVRRVVKKS